MIKKCPQCEIKMSRFQFYCPLCREIVWNVRLKITMLICAVISIATAFVIADYLAESQQPLLEQKDVDIKLIRKRTYVNGQRVAE